MTQISKARWSTEGDTLHMGMEFSKVNKAKRLVSGWATLDNVDTQNDVVTAEASAKAFARARGNLREMHKKDSAVGKIVSFKEDEITIDGERYRGIFVTARVSEGAQDTWLKVLDGTLNGFSIGGNVIKSEKVISKATGETINKVTDYELTELSLVDNPANPYADVVRVEKNVFTFNKAADGSVTVEGMAAEQDIYNVFYCEDDKITQEKREDSYECPICTEEMSNIGFIENVGDLGEKVNAVVTKYLSAREGGEEMAKGNDAEGPKDNDSDLHTESNGQEAGDPAEVPTPTETEDNAVGGTADEVEKSANVEEVETPAVEDEAPEDVEEVHDEGEEIAKQIDGLKETITSILNDTKAETAAKIEALEKSVSDTRELLDSKISELDQRFTAINEDLETTKSKQANLEDSLNKINSSGAFSKSVDSDESPVVQKSETTWNGAFSIDNVLM